MVIRSPFVQGRRTPSSPSYVYREALGQHSVDVTNDQAPFPLDCEVALRRGTQWCCRRGGDPARVGVSSDNNVLSVPERRTTSMARVMTGRVEWRERLVLTSGVDLGVEVLEDLGDRAG